MSITGFRETEKGRGRERGQGRDEIGRNVHQSY